MYGIFYMDSIWIHALCWENSVSRGEIVIYYANIQIIFHQLFLHGLGVCDIFPTLINYYIPWMLI